MLNLFLLLLVAAVSMMAILWIGTFFFQGYIYLEPSQQLYWQAPAAGGLLTLGFAIWCIWIATTPGASPQSVPIDTIFRFSPTVEMLDKPAPRVTAIKRPRNKAALERKEEETVTYISVQKDQKKFQYMDTTLVPRPWQRSDVIAVEIEKPDGTKIRFDSVPVGPGEYPRFQSKDGWVMNEYDTGPTGLPTKFSLGRMILNIAFNVGHYLGWFIVLWLILRFQWGHAMSLAIVFWLIVTLAVLPMMLTYAAYVASLRYPPLA